MEKLRTLDAEEIRYFALLLATLPGPLMLFNGQLEAVLGYSYRSCQVSSINWGSVDEHMQAYFDRIAAFAHQPLLRLGAAHAAFPKPAAGHPEIVAYVRTLGKEKALVVARAGYSHAEGTAWARMDVSELLVPGAEQYEVVNAFSGDRYPAVSREVLERDGLTVGLSAKEVQVLSLEPVSVSSPAIPATSVRADDKGRFVLQGIRYNVSIRFAHKTLTIEKVGEDLAHVFDGGVLIAKLYPSTQSCQLVSVPRQADDKGRFAYHGNRFNLGVSFADVALDLLPLQGAWENGFEVSCGSERVALYRAATGRFETFYSLKRQEIGRAHV